MCGFTPQPGQPHTLPTSLTEDHYPVSDRPCTWARTMFTMVRLLRWFYFFNNCIRKCQSK